MLPKPSSSKNALGDLRLPHPRNAVLLGALKIKFHSITTSPSTNGPSPGQQRGLYLLLQICSIC